MSLARFVSIQRRFLRESSLNWRTISNLTHLDKNIVDQINQSQEDVASFVRFNRNVQRISVEDFSHLYLDQPESERLKLLIDQICHEYRYLCNVNMRVPSAISTDDMRKLVKMRNFEKRQIYFINAYFRDTVKVRSKVKNFLKSTKRASLYRPFERSIFSETGQVQYGLWKNCLFLRTRTSPRLLCQSALNAIQWAPILAFDWQLPPDLNLDSLNPVSIKKLAYKMFIVCNHNIQIGSLPFEILHLNVSNDNVAFESFAKHIHNSAIDSRFFVTSTKCLGDKFPNRPLIYISSCAEETFTNHDMRLFGEEEKPVFIFSPYSELKNLKRQCLQMLHDHCGQMENVYCRKLPLHEVTHSQRHVTLNNVIKCFHDVVIESHHWPVAIKRHVSRKNVDKILLEKL